MRNKTHVIILFLIIINIMMPPLTVEASATDGIWQEMDLDVAEKTLKDMFPEYHFDGKQVLSLIMQGKILKAAGALVSGIGDAFLSQIGEIRALFVMILILGITAALFSNFADVFQSRQVSDIAFYFIYLLLIAVLIKVFGNSASIVKGMLNQVITFIQVLIPTYLLAIGTASGAASAVAYNQLFFIVVYIIQQCYLSILIPLINSFVLLSIINGVWMEEKLNMMLDLADKFIGGCIKITLGIITGFSILQSMVSPIVDALEASALKKAVSVIPGIGNLTEGMFEMVIGSAVLIKNSIGIYITIVMIIVCALPILKILLLAGVLKLGAALIGIVSDKRMTNCANRVGDGSLMLLKLALSAIALFIISIAIAAYSTNRGM